MDKGFCRDQQRPRLFKSNIPINRDKFAGLICLHAFFCVRRAVNSSNLFYVSPLYNKKTAKPLVYTNVPIQAYTLGVLRAVLVALTNVYDGKKDIRTYAHFFGMLSTYIYIGPGRIYIYVTFLHPQDYHLQNRVCKRYFLTVISVTSLSTCSAARANNYFIHKQ